MSVYVLQLQEGKYYVGHSTNVKFRINQHFEGIGSAWTKLYPPISVIQEIDGDYLLEDTTTKQYMMKYGIANVRGASYCQVVLSKSSLESLEREIAHLCGACFKCGGIGHLANNCLGGVKTRDQKKKMDSNLLCCRCGRNNHLVNACYAKTRLDGTTISDSNDSRGHFQSNSSEKSRDTSWKNEWSKSIKRNVLCYRCGRNDHLMLACSEKIHLDGTVISDSDDSDEDDTIPTSIPCDRCGRFGHVALICNHAKDIYDNPLGGGFFRKLWTSLTWG